MLKRSAFSSRPSRSFRRLRTVRGRGFLALFLLGTLGNTAAPLCAQSSYGYGYGYGRYGYGQYGYGGAPGAQGTQPNPYVPTKTGAQGQSPFPVGGGQGLRLPGVGGGFPVRLPGLGGQGSGAQSPFPFLPSLGGREEQGKTRPQTRNLERWPSFVTMGGPGKVPFEEAKIRNPKRAVLFRTVDRVLVRPRGERAFYPLAFWDKKRVLASGSQIRVLGSGRYLLLFSDGTRMDVLREGALDLDRIDRKGLELSMKVRGRVQIKLGLRKLRLKLSDGTVLVAKGGSFRIDRIFRDGPGAGDRSRAFLRIRNGDASLEVQPSGALIAPFKIRPFWQVLLPLLEEGVDEAVLDQKLQGKEAQVQADSWVRFRSLRGGKLEARAEGAEGRLRLGGVQFSIPPGKTLILDPLLGAPFSGGRPVRARASGSSSASKPSPKNTGNPISPPVRKN
ncbi:MAG TPA: hypothetical protein ENK02_06795 [Planctomycetes bacterium]|nr:hypothetical protein [Planctomycetota bacterium]